jgi:hypothetical protein
MVPVTPISDAFFAPLKSKDSNRFAHWKGVVFGPSGFERRKSEA